MFHILSSGGVSLAAKRRQNPQSVPGRVVAAPCFNLRHQPTWASPHLASLALLKQCFVKEMPVSTPQTLWLFFLSLFHTDIYSCNSAGRIKIKQCLPSLSPHALPPVLPFPSTQMWTECRSTKPNPFFPFPVHSVACKKPTPTCAQMGLRFAELLSS